MSAGTNLTRNIHSVDRTGDFLVNVGMGLYSDLGSVEKFGRNPDVDTGSEDLWAAGGTWVGPTTARIHDIVSTSIADDVGSTGAETIRIFGLDANYAFQQEDISMDGQTNVPTVNTYTMIHRMLVLTAGSGATNAGAITATAQTDATVTCQIGIGVAQTQLGVYQIPAGYTGHVIRYGGSTDGTAGVQVDIALVAKPFGGVYNLKHNFTLRAGGSSNYAINIPFGIHLTEKTIVKLRATVDGANNDVSGSFSLLLRNLNP